MLKKTTKTAQTACVHTCQVSLPKPLVSQVTPQTFEPASPLPIAGRDLLFSAPTGSGKTGAFLIPIVARLMMMARETTRNRVYPSVIILSPTRELAIQLHEATRKLVLGTHINVAVVHGGAPLAEQASGLVRGAW